jgi:F-type H+-transporting ATPase subunit a
MVPAPSILPLAAGGHELPMAPVEIFKILGLPITNSMVVSWVVALVLIGFAQYATRQVRMVPEGAQNFWEWFVELLGGVLEGILGRELMLKTFWFFGSIFIFILTANWFALIPGVGTVGEGVGEHWWNLALTQPFIRGTNADINMTGGMAIVFFFLWWWWSLRGLGLGGTIHHIFGSKSNLPGLMGGFIAVLFVLVGVIELISIMFRPIALACRLYGNIYGGEFMLESVYAINPFWGWLIPMPFYVLEVLVGMVQALVFCLLTAVFTGLMLRHEEGHAEGGH